jgi:hypothetical protein
MLVGFVRSSDKECGVGRSHVGVDDSISVNVVVDPGINRFRASPSLSSELSCGIGASPGDGRILS